MTKEAYLEMCEQLGTIPVPSEIPVEYSDFPEEIRTALDIWQILPNNIESFSGTYYGKHLTGLTEILELFDVPQVDRRFYITMLHKINELQLARYQSKKLNKSIKASPKG